jgi:integrase
VEDFWLPSLVGQQLKYTTIAQYAEKVRYSLDALGDRPVQNIQSLDVERLRSDLLDRGLSPRTVSLALVTLSLALDHAQDIGNLITENPCKKVKKPRSRHKPRGVMSIDQMRRIEHASQGSQWESFIRLAPYSGARRGEILGLRWSDIDLETQTVTFSVNAVEVEGRRNEHTTKSDEPRTITLDDETVAEVRDSRLVSAHEEGRR